MSPVSVFTVAVATGVGGATSFCASFLPNNFSVIFGPNIDVTARMPAIATVTIGTARAFIFLFFLTLSILSGDTSGIISTGGSSFVFSATGSGSPVSSRRRRINSSRFLSNSSLRLVLSFSSSEIDFNSSSILRRRLLSSSLAAFTLISPRLLIVSRETSPAASPPAFGFRSSFKISSNVKSFSLIICHPLRIFG